ncbi:MAG: DJ-1/PfpI family protein [Gammaproteobacteria bacterium]|nr:DJ-1/PfpI family protein [Gammaproteobacteria bacterium]MBV9724683.1 DJ-1/PfpI family protein [Gammaproteobacteria bacterium]
MADADFTVVFALYPEITQLDFTAPAEVFARLPRARMIFASVSGGELCAGGLTFAGLHRLAEVDACDLLCVPGGVGCSAAMEDAEYVGALRRLAGKARYITSVCTGSLLLGAAGLLQGRRAACHWAFRELLELFGAIPDAGRVVRDGHIVSGGGVTAGIDMALSVCAEIAGVAHAQAVQLALEYAPEAPFACGRPEAAPAEVVTAVRERLARAAPERRAAAERAARALTRDFARSGSV